VIDYDHTSVSSLASLLEPSGWGAQIPPSPHERILVGLCGKFNIGGSVGDRFLTITLRNGGPFGDPMAVVGSGAIPADSSMVFYAAPGLPVAISSNGATSFPLPSPHGMRIPINTVGFVALNAAQSGDEVTNLYVELITKDTKAK
jgi:hypothetical protein